MHIQEKQNTGENMMFQKFMNQFEGEGGGGGGGGDAFQSSTTSPLGYGPAMLCKFRHKRQEIKNLPWTATSKKEY